MKQLRAFLDSPATNLYIKEEHFTIYVRKGYHNIVPIGPCHTFDIANITLPVKLQGKGRFWTLLDHIEAVLLEDPSLTRIIYVENIMNNKFLAKLRRMGFEYATHSDELCKSVYRIIKEPS